MAIEQNSLLLKGASELPSRLHLGGEYPKDKTTAYQCLFGATLFRQMFQTEGVLTPIKANDFLLSRESIQSSQPDAYLSESDFISHYELLNKAYANYLEQLKSKGSDEEVEKLLFGSLPLFYKIEGKEWEELGVDHHFALGLRTKERGLQAVGLGVILESLLNTYNVKIMYNCRVEDIQLLSEGGFVIKSGVTSPLYARYLINAAWDNNSYLEWLINRHDLSKASLVRQDSPRPVKHVFLRSLALIDTTSSSLPKTSSFFGLVGKSGGMVSCFNQSFATIFIPQEGLSYQGQYDLSPAEAYPHALPYQAIDKRESLKDQAHQERLAQEILNDAQHKYPFLKGSKALGVITHTTLSDNDEVHKRTHSHAYWVENTNALQLCATKMTFAPFVACQAIARLVFDHSKDFLPSFNSQENEYLSQFREKAPLSDKKSVWNACLPDSFTLVKDDSFIRKPEFLENMRLYAFHRHLPFTIFEESEEAKRAGRNFDKQFDLIAKNTALKTLDLGYHPLPLSIIHSLIEFLKNNKVLTIVKIGQLEKINDDEEDELGGQILSELSKIHSLQKVTLKGWNLSFSKRYKPLAILTQRLGSIAFEEGTTLTARGINYIVTTIPHPLPLRHFRFSDGNLTEQALEEFFIFTKKLPDLQSLDMKGNILGPRLKNDVKGVLSTLISSLPHLEKLDLSRNHLFDSFQSNEGFPDDLPLSLEAHPLILGITNHPNLKEVDVTGNGTISSILQDRLENLMRLKNTQP